MARGSYAAVVDLLAPLAGDAGNASLLFVLEDARNRLQSLQHEMDTAMQTAEALSSQEQYAEAISFLESLPPSVLHAEPLQTALQRLHQANESELATLQAVGRCYAALDSQDLGSGALQDSGGSAEASLLQRMVPVFTSRRKSVADRQLTSAMEQARSAMDAGDRKRAAKLLREVASFSQYSSNDLQSEWQALTKKAEKGKWLRSQK